MKKMLKKALWFTVVLCPTMFLAVACPSKKTEPKVSDLNFTSCKQDENVLDKVDVEFTDKGVQITYYNFAVTCDFTTVNVTYTFVEGVLDITQQGSPNKENCICYTDVSYTIEGISQDETGAIFINGVKVCCNNVEIPYEECTHEGVYTDTIQMEGMGYLFLNSIPADLLKNNNVMYIVYNQEDNLTTFSATYPMEAFYNGNICNFPDFAKEWEIPAEGKQIYYKGNLYVRGTYPSIPPSIGGDLILITFE